MLVEEVQHEHEALLAGAIEDDNDPEERAPDTTLLCGILWSTPIQRLR